jgi:NADPH-dependent 2,4-dienoyl-CoA reductase/sulfur reductase-like enzyme
MKVVIVGGGLAAASAAEELRKAGHEGDVTIVGAEPHPPYERPPLSKAVLLGTATPESTHVHDVGWYAEQGIDLRTGATVTALDLDRCHVLVGDEELAYDRLLLATGATPRRLAMVDDAGVPAAYLRTVDDAVALRPRLTGHVLVVGAGWIGLEVAAAARAAGARVTVVEPAEEPLLAVLGPRLGHVFADLHREHGVDLRLGTGLDAVGTDDAGRTRARLSDGTEVSPDLVVVGIGAEPLDGLARTAGLATDHGILVDARLRASDPHVYAAGDVAQHDHPVLGRRIRVEHWDTAIHQGRAAARAMLGDDAPYERLPYFFTDQYDLGMEYVGHAGPAGSGAEPDEVVVRGDEAARVLTAFWLREGTVVAAAHLNDWDAIDDLRALVGRSVPVVALRDPGVPLSDLHG